MRFPAGARRSARRCCSRSVEDAADRGDGAPISRTRGNKLRALGMLRYYASQATRSMARPSKTRCPAKSSPTRRRGPLDVVGAIIPWNGPLTASI
jgi:aldehyde dehydrogenase (NAD+)